MKHKICILLLAFTTAACGVEIKDKNADQPEQVQVQSQQDYVIDGPVTLTENLNIETERLVLTRNAVITTEDKDLFIKAKEIISEGAVIRNFAPDARAHWEKDGRTGGSITIATFKATGSLQVELRGEGGGSGKHGVITNPKHGGCWGTTGGQGGNAGSLRAEILDKAGFNISMQNLGGAFGPAGVRGSVPYGTEYAVHPPCANDIVGGTNGQPGHEGQVCYKFGSQESFQCN